MNRKTRNQMILTLGGAAALAVALLGGEASLVNAAPSADTTMNEARDALAKGKVDKAIKLAEKAVAGNPREGGYRAMLGQAYLRAGRFGSAVTAFNDAMKLGDNSARTALGLALAQTATGHGHDAVAILDDWRDAIPASDLGLALALAGESSRGTAILADAVRGGDASPKLRQNLAYAYALDGRWREARQTLSQDIAPDAVDRRLGEWASRARPEDAKLRVASLINAPLRDDPGQPTALALNETPAAEQAATETGATRPAPAVAAGGELPAVVPGGAAPARASVPAPVPVSAQSLASYAPVNAPAPAAAPVPAAVPAPAPSASFAAAFPAKEAPADLVIAPSAPVAAPAPAAAAPASTNSAPAAPAKPVAVASVRHSWAKAAPASLVPAKAGTHLVQLGSFSSAQGARRAWGILAARNPALRQFKMVITPATVRGRAYWRVAAAGFDGHSAQGMCAAVKARGGPCFAYAAAHAWPTHVGAPQPMMARAQPVHSTPARPAPALAHAVPIRPAPVVVQKGSSGPVAARRH